MSTVLDPITTPPPIDETRSLADLLHDLGDVPPERVRLYPPPGTVTFEQFVEINERVKPICEWVENTMVEKAVGQHESWLTFLIIGKLHSYMEEHNPGQFLAPDGVLRILPKIGRAPDISFIAWSSLPGGKPLPREVAVPTIVPDFAIEVISKTNTKQEMKRKRREYFDAGVKLVWEIDPKTRTARVYTTNDDGTHFDENGILVGEPVLPGFRLSLTELFARADHGAGESP